MRKLPSLYKRDWDGNPDLVTDELNPGLEKVLNGECYATYKYDGTSTLIKDGELYRRREVKAGKETPPDWVSCGEDLVTGKRVGWIPCKRDEPSDRYHYEAYDAYEGDLEEGTYELCGPAVQSNPHNLDSHVLIPHGKNVVPLAYPLTREYLAKRLPELAEEYKGLGKYEGLVWWDENGPVCKLKLRDLS